MPKINSWEWQDYPVTESTNDLAREKGMLFEGQPVVFTAVRQTKGRGRRGRQWVSVPGNLFMSQFFKTDLPLWNLVFITSLSIAQAIAGVTSGLDIAIKWPNDVLIKGKKICGILIETADNDAIIIGVGVNLASSPQSSGILYQTTDLKTLGFNISRESFLAEYLACFDRLLDLCRRQGFAAIRKMWLQYAAHLGQVVKVCQGEVLQEGVFKGIDEQGFLLLKQKEKVIKIAAGDVFL